MIHSAISPYEVSSDLIEALRAFPSERDIEHCGQRFPVSTFAFYATCPTCNSRIKVRGMSSHAELPDLLDAAFEWIARPENVAAARQRQQELADDPD